MDDNNNVPGSPTHEEADTPEYTPTDSESSTDEADAMEPDTKKSFSQGDLESHLAPASADDTDVVESEDVVGEIIGDNCVDHLEDESDSHKSNTNERHFFEENMLNLDAEGVEKCKQCSKENLDDNSAFSVSPLDSEANSKTSIVFKDALNRTEQDDNPIHKDCGSTLTDNMSDIDEACIEAKMTPNGLQNGESHSLENTCKMAENGYTEFPMQISVDKGSINSDVHLETVDDEHVVSTEMLSDSEDQDFTLHEKADFSITEGETIIAKALVDLPKADIEASTDGETQGQGDTSHSVTDDTSSDGTVHRLKTSYTEELSDDTMNERSVSNGEEAQLKLSKTLEHVSEVPRGLFESILYKLYIRMNQRSPRAKRDISRGPCVKQLVKEFSKEAMECPKFPKSQSVQVRKTQEEIPKSKLFESFSDTDDSWKYQSVQIPKLQAESPRSLLSESFSDIHDRGFESRTEASTDEEHLSSDEVPMRSSTPSREVMVMEIRNELQKLDCSRKRVIQLIKRFGGKGSFKTDKKNEDKVVKTEMDDEAKLPAKDVDEGCLNKDVKTDDMSKSEPVCEKLTDCPRNGSYAWLTNVSVKNLVAIFSDISKSPALSRRSASRASKKCCVGQGKEASTKLSRTMETQTPGTEAIGSCSNVLLLLQPEYNGSNMLSSRFERKRSTLSMCLPVAEPEDYGPTGEPLRPCASATGLLLVSTAEPVRVRTLRSPDDNRTALSQLAHLLHMPERKAQVRACSVTRDSSLVRQMVEQFDRSSAS